MHASKGDRIIVHGHRTGEPSRECDVLEVHGDDGTAPFVVRWTDTGQEGIFFPGPDATVEHYDRASP
jgi:hypothetical protein